MNLKLLATAVVAASSLAACYTARPVVVETPAPPAQTILVPVPVASDAPSQNTQMPTQDAAPMSLHDQVHAALQSGLGAAADGISVRVQGTKVYLSGHVATKADHDRAHEIAHDVPGVTFVDHSGLKVP